MGWFGNICSAVSSAVTSTAKAVGRAVGTGMEVVGTITNSESLRRMGSSLKEMCTEVEYVAREASKVDSYDKEKARLIETQRINETLSKFSLNLQTQADELEEDALKESKVYFEYLIEQLRKTSDANNMKININRIKRDIFKIEKGIKGSFKDYLAKRISLDDQECLTVLKMEAGTEKEAAMKRLGNKVLKEAREQLCDNIKECLIDQQEYIEDEIVGKMNEIILNLKDLSTKVSEFETLKQSNEGQIELEKVTCISKLQIIDMALGILE